MAIEQTRLIIQVKSLLMALLAIVVAFLYSYKLEADSEIPIETVYSINRLHLRVEFTPPYFLRVLIVEQFLNAG